MADERKTAAELSTTGRWWVTQPNELAPERSSNLPAGVPEPPRMTVWEVFQETVSKRRDDPALHFNPRDAGEGKLAWETLTWRKYYAAVRSFAASLLALGFERYQSVNIIGFNHPRWATASLGCMAAGGLAAGVYTTNKSAAVGYIANHSQAAVVVVEDLKQLNKYIDVAGELEALKAIVVYGGSGAGRVRDADREAWAGSGSEAKLYGWEEFMGLGEVEDHSAEIDARIAAQKPGNCAMLIYTSGTTGPPKAVMISHDNLTFTAVQILKRLFLLTSEDRVMSYLPLSHIAGCMIDMITPMVGGTQVYFVPPDALKGRLKDYLQAVEPTIFFGVPRVWEKIREALEPRFAAATGVKAKILRWSQGKGRKRMANIQYGGSGGAPCCFGFAKKKVFDKLQAALGLSKCRVFATGAAPISMETLNFFGDLNMPIYEVFGQSECTGPQTQAYPDPAGGAGQFKMGTSGPAVPLSFMAVQQPAADGAERGVRLDSGEGEVVYSGRHIMMGYMHNPAKTAEAIDEDGYLHSGDKGVIDADGFLKITGRYKELLITAGGENVAPVLIEQCWKAHSPAISNAMVIGDRRKYLSMIITMKVDVDLDTLVPSHNLTAPTKAFGSSLGSRATTTDEAAKDPVWVKHFNDVMAAANKEAISRAQTIKKWTLLAGDFSVPGGELTATLKLKRSVAAKIHADVIEGMYGGAFTGKSDQA